MNISFLNVKLGGFGIAGWLRNYTSGNSVSLNSHVDKSTNGGVAFANREKL